jgi:putative transposase
MWSKRASRCATIPFDLGVVYAYVQGHWLVCRSPYHSLLEGRTEKELLVATAEMRRRARRDQTRTDLSAARLAAFITSAQAHEELLMQRWRDLEGHQVLEIIARMAPVGVPLASLPSEATRTVSLPPEEGAARIAPVDLTTLPVLGDYR